MFFKVCSYFSQQLFKFGGISSSQSKEIFRSCCKISFTSSIDRVKSPNEPKRDDIKLSKRLFDSRNGFITALSNRILSKSRLTDWQFADKSSWGKDFKISLSFDTNLVKWNPPFFQNFGYFFAYIYSFCLT